MPVGNIFIEAVNPTANAQMSISENIPFAGATTSRDFVLLKADSPKAIVVKTGHGDRSRAAKHGLAPSPACRSSSTTPAEASRESAVRASPEEMRDRPRHDRCRRRVSFPGVPAGQLARDDLRSGTLQEGEASLILAADATGNVNIVISGGLGTSKASCWMPPAPALRARASAAG